jgi:hypothetical protein
VSSALMMLPRAFATEQVGVEPWAVPGYSIALQIASNLCGWKSFGLF